MNAAHLKPPKNLREIKRACCGMCRYGFYSPRQGTFNCERPNGPRFETGYGKEWYHVCDGFKSQDEDSHD